MEIFIIIYIILASFAYASTLGLAGNTDIFNTKYDIFNTKYEVLLIAMFALLIVTPILNIIPIIVYLVLINKNLKQ